MYWKDSSPLEKLRKVVVYTIGGFAIAGSLIGGCLGSCAVTNHINYGEGKRAGQITKISRKGVFWKTYEARMNVGGTMAGDKGNIVPEIWDFSLDSSRRNGENTEKILSDLEKATETGERVEVKYKQYLTLAPWNGETDYYAQDVRFLEKE